MGAIDGSSDGETEPEGCSDGVGVGAMVGETMMPVSETTKKSPCSPLALEGSFSCR